MSDLDNITEKELVTKVVLGESKLQAQEPAFKPQETPSLVDWKNGDGIQAMKTRFKTLQSLNGKDS